MMTGHEMQPFGAACARLGREEMRRIVGGEGEPGSLLELLLQPPPLDPFPPSTGPTFPAPPRNSY